MYRLRDLKNGLFQIHVMNGPAFEGPRHHIYVAATELGIQEKEFFIALDELKKHDHDYAEFGIFGGFIFTARDRKAA